MGETYLLEYKTEDDPEVTQIEFDTLYAVQYFIDENCDQLWEFWIVTDFEGEIVADNSY